MSPKRASADTIAIAAIRGGDFGGDFGPYSGRIIFSDDIDPICANNVERSSTLRQNRY